MFRDGSKAYFLITFKVDGDESPVDGIANYYSLPLFSFGQALGKLQGKVVTHFEEVGWWRTLMVECVTLF